MRRGEMMVEQKKKKHAKENACGRKLRGQKML